MKPHTGKAAIFITLHCNIKKKNSLKVQGLISELKKISTTSATATKSRLLKKSPAPPAVLPIFEKDCFRDCQNQLSAQVAELFLANQPSSSTLHIIQFIC